jgi:hypothetical protein
MLLVDHNEAEVVKVDVASEKCVRPHNDPRLARLCGGKRNAPFLRPLGTREERDASRVLARIKGPAIGEQA